MSEKLACPTDVAFVKLAALGNTEAAEVEKFARLVGFPQATTIDELRERMAGRAARRLAAMPRRGERKGCNSASSAARRFSKVERVLNLIKTNSAKIRRLL